jgi:di/tricarboxylate transporter
MTQADRWKNRRRMAWAALLGGLAFPLLLLWSESDQLGSVAGAFYVFVGAVLASYFGWATVDDNNFKDAAEPADWPDKAGKGQ